MAARLFVCLWAPDPNWYWHPFQGVHCTRVQSSPAWVFFLIFLQRGARPTGLSSNEYVQRSPPILMLLLLGS